jgi:DNA-binding response OmpR family regulator
MDDLQQFYRGAVGDQVAALEHALLQLESGAASAEETVRQLAHTLKGSGTSYGFPEVSFAAGVAERAPAGELWSKGRELVDILKAITAGVESNTIVVVEDDPLVSHFIAAELAGGPQRLVRFSSLGEAGRFLSTSQTPALILLDLFLPDGDGRTLLHTLRDDEATVDVPVIVMSAASSEIRNREVAELAATAFISKPFGAGELRSLIDQILGSPVEDRLSSRVDLTDAYRVTVQTAGSASVACVLPEQHGPGGLRTTALDDAATQPIIQVLREHLGPHSTVGIWEAAEIAIVSADPPDVLVKQLDDARYAWRNSPRPTGSDTVASFSASVIAESGGASLVDTYARALRFALDVHETTGDSVVMTDQIDHPRRVLLAEDDTLTAALIIHRLEREGYQVEHHANGASALAAADDHHFGLVVLDVQMPGANGFDVLKRIRSNPDFNHTPVVMLTAVGGERDVVRGFELGADDYILKPFSPAELTARLKRFTRAHT